MADFDTQVLAGERERHATSPHLAGLVIALAGWLPVLAGVWLIYRAAHSAFLARFLAQPLLQDLAGPGPLPVARWLTWLCALAALAVVAAAVFDYLSWRWTSYVLTDTRVIKLTGVLNRLALETPLERVDDLLVAQGPVGKRFDYGDLVILRAQEGSGVVMARMRAPFRFKQRLLAARAARLARMLQTALAPSLAPGVGTPLAGPSPAAARRGRLDNA